MSEKILCVKIEHADMPHLIGEISELPELLETVYGWSGGIPDGTKFTVTIHRMTEQELNDLPDWNP